MQVKSLRNGVAVTAAILFSQMAPVAQAQPDLDNAPKGDNPPARQRPPRPANGMGVPDEAIRKMMEMGGVPDVAIQDAVLAYMKDDMAARRPLRDLGMKLLQALRAADINNEQMLALVTDYRAAQQSEKVRREQAQLDLDAKVNYSQNPRLEAMLLLGGVIGEGGGLVGAGGAGGFAMRPGQGRNAQNANPLAGNIPGGNGVAGAQGANAQRREENLKRMLKRFDKNANGQLDPEENAAMKQWREERREARQAKKNPAANALQGNIPADPAVAPEAEADDELDMDMNEKN